MKKTLIALALVSLPVAASAEVILYGVVKAGVEYESNATRASTGDKEKAANIVDYGTRIGFKGSEDLNNGLKAIWQIETHASLGDGTVGNRGRDSFIGLEGGFGTVRAGYVSSPLKVSVDNQDMWEYDSPILGLGYYTRFGERRTSLNYNSPNWGGFDFAFQFTPGNNYHGSPTNDKQPVYGLGLNYANSGFFGRYAMDYHTIRNGKDSHVHNLVGGYDANNLYVALGLQYAKNVGGTFQEVKYGTDKTTEAQLTGAYTFGAVTPKLTAAYGKASDSGARYTQVVAGADYAFSRRTTGLVSLGWLREKAHTGAENVNSWAVGTRLVHKF